MQGSGILVSWDFQLYVVSFIVQIARLLERVGKNTSPCRDESPLSQVELLSDFFFKIL